MTTENYAQELNSLVKEFRQTHEELKKNSSNAELKEKSEKIEARINELEVKNQAIVIEKAQEAKKIEELETEIKNLEKRLSRPAVGSQEEAKEMPELAKKFYDAFFCEDKMTSSVLFNEYKKTLEKTVENTAWGKKYLRSDVMTDGGVLCFPEYNKEIIKKITEVSPVRQVAKVRATTGATLHCPTRTVLLSSGWAGEGIDASTSNSKYGKEVLTARRLTVNVAITQQELMNSAFDMASEIQSDVVEEFARKEGLAFVSGTGVEQPSGFMVDANVTTRNSGIANSVDFDSIILLTGDVKVGYNPMFSFNRRTRAYLMTLKSSIGQYLWTAGNVAAGQPNMIAGRPYIEMIDMDDIGSNTYPIIYGDFGKGYLIADRMAMTLIRDDYTEAKKAMVNFIFNRYVDGAVVLPEAFKKLKCAV